MAAPTSWLLGTASAKVASSLFTANRHPRSLPSTVATDAQLHRHQQGPQDGIIPFKWHLQSPRSTLRLAPISGHLKQNRCWPGCGLGSLKPFNLSSLAVRTITVWARPSCSVLCSLPAGTLYSNQTVLHWRQKSMPWAQNPMCSSEMGQSLWTHASPPASGMVTAEGVSRLNYTKYASLPKQQLQRKKLVSNGYY